MNHKLSLWKLKCKKDTCNTIILWEVGGFLRRVRCTLTNKLRIISFKNLAQLLLLFYSQSSFNWSPNLELLTQLPSQSAPTIFVLKTWVGLRPWKKWGTLFFEPCFLHSIFLTQIFFQGHKTNHAFKTKIVGADWLGVYVALLCPNDP